MEYRWSLGDQTFPRLLRRWDDRSIGQFESRLQGRKLQTFGGEGNWPLQRLILSTVSVNTVLWALITFVHWRAFQL